MQRTDRRLVLAVVSLASFLLNFDLAGIIVAMPSIQVAFGASSDQLSWAQNSFAFAGCATLPLVGVLCDRLGRARVFCAAAAVFALASVGCAVAQSIDQLTWWRTGQGIGAAAFLALGTALLADSWGRDVSRTLGFITGAGAIGLSLGPVLSGALVDVLSWRTLLAIEAGAGALLMIAALVVLTGLTSQHRASVDPIGAFAATVAIASTVVFVHLIQSHQGLGALAASAVLALTAAATFLMRQRAARTPALPRAVWKAPGFRVIMALGLLAYIALSSTAFFVSLVAQSVDDWTALAAGLIMLPVTLGLVVGTLIGPRLTRRIGVRAVVVLGYSACVVGTVALLGLSTNAIGWTLVVVGNAISGLGVG
ncbi:MAG: MFS transporter, partial [Actinomycetales bacterium]